MPEAGLRNFTIDFGRRRVQGPSHPRRITMVAIPTAVLALALTAVASAQTTPPPTRDAPNPTGRTIIPEKKEQGRPKGDEGPATSKPADGTAGARPSGEAPAPQRPAKEK
jgi:hypothetical protein